MDGNYETLQQRVQYCTDTFGPPKDFRLQQAGDLDIEFTGWEISAIDDGELKADRPTVDVCTFYSVRGAYVAEIVRHLPNRDGPERPHVVKAKAAAFVATQDLLKWLKEDGRGWLGDNSKLAWEEMCRKLPWIKESEAIKV